MSAKFPLFKVHIPVEEALANIREVFDSGFINEGEQVTKLTELLSKKLQTNKLLLLNSCTSALTVALKLAGVGPGDEVITTPMTCVASNTPIHNLGAKVVWADVNPHTGMIDPESISQKITAKTKAVIAVAWAGTPPDILGINDVLGRGKERKAKLIMDAAHAFGAKYHGSPLGEHQADYTCYSFQAIKHFTTGDGGALICRDPDDFKRAKALKWFGLDRDLTKDEKGNWKGQQWDTDIVEAGYKFNMNNVAAAIGLAQLEHIDRLVESHRQHASLYDSIFADWEPVRTPLRQESHRSACWTYTLVLRDDRINRDVLLEYLNAEGIAAGLVHVPNDAYTCFKDSATDLPGVREFARRQFSLPCGWWLTDDDVLHIANRVKELTK